MKKIVNDFWMVLIFYISIVFITTFPLLLKINSYIPGFFSTDESFAILWVGWLTKFSIINHLPINFTDFIAYPFGVRLYSFIVFINFIINFLLSIFTTPMLVYNLQVVINIFLTALISYFFVYYLIKEKFCAFFSGVIFGFCPYIFVRSWQHLGATYLWPLPLFTWFIFRLKDERNLKTKLLVILSFIVSTVNFDITYYLLVLTGILIVYLCFSFKKNKAYIVKILYLISIAFILTIPQSLPIIFNVLFRRNSVPMAQNIFHRPFEDLFTQSARPLSYLLPSVAHPIFGKFTEQFVGTQFYGISFTEHTLYLGWLPLFLALFALKKWEKNGKAQIISEDDNFNIGFFVILTVIAWFFSQPPWWQIGPLKVYMPSFFMYRVLPMIRAYCRFGVVVMFAISVLAGFGLKFILERFKSNKTKISITTLACSLVLFEFWNWPPYKVIDVSKVPAVYYWIKNQPGDFVIAEYPLDTLGPNEMYKFYQIKHEKKIINATIPGTYANKVAKTITKLSDPNTTGVLKWMGVRYALVHREDYLNTGLIQDKEELDKIPKNPYLKFIKTFPSQECPQKDIMCVQKTGPIDIYEVIASPIRPKVE